MYKGSNLTLLVSDFNRSLHFYTESLGMELAVRHGDDWAEVQGPGIQFGIHPGGDRGPVAATQERSTIHIGLEVEDLDAAIALLRQRGVEFQATSEADTAIRAAAFHDPDGHGLYLFQMRSDPSTSHPEDQSAH